MSRVKFGKEEIDAWETSLPLTCPSYLRGGPTWESGHPRICQQGNHSYSSCSYMNLLLMGPRLTGTAPGSWPRQGSRNRLEVWRSCPPELPVSPTLLPSSILPGSYRGKGRLPAAHIKPEASSCFHMAASRNAFDHLIQVVLIHQIP